MQKSIFLAILIVSLFSNLSAAEAPPVNVLVVGWDGTRLERLQALLQEGKLPNLAKFIETGSFVHVNIKYTRTDTKAGWSEILTGYDAKTTGVFSNKFYKPIPKGLTLFERLKERFGGEIQTALITGKTNNLGIRGPHKICINCLPRFEGTRLKSEWWEENSKAAPYNHEKKKLEARDGEPYYYAAKSIDYYKNKLLEGRNVLRESKKLFAKLKGKHFFAFVHYEEPDEPGHIYGEHSPQYTQGLIDNDKHFGLMLADLKKKGMDKNLKIFLMGDHGFDIIGSGRADDKEHETDAARTTFFACDTKGIRAEGDRRDFPTTILKLYGFDLSKMEPKLQGNPYF